MKLSNRFHIEAKRKSFHIDVKTTIITINLSVGLLSYDSIKKDPKLARSKIYFLHLFLIVVLEKKNYFFLFNILRI